MASWTDVLTQVGSVVATKGRRFQVDVADYATPQAALNAVAPGGRVFFGPGTYAIPQGGYSIPVDEVHIDALGARFTVSDWGTPAFDGLGRNRCLYDIGLVEYVGTRGTHGGAQVRGQAPYTIGCGVYTNGDGNHIRYLRTIGMPTPINLASYDGASAFNRVGVGNKIGRLECSGFDFGILWVRQNNLVIEDIYAYDDIDDSGGVNPTHAYYASGTETQESTGVTILKARADRISGGQAFQIKGANQVFLGPHYANDCAGLINLMNCTDLSWQEMRGTGMKTNRSITVQQENVNKTLRLRNSYIDHAADQNIGTPFLCVGDDVEIDGLEITQRLNTASSFGPSAAYIIGTGYRIRDVTLASISPLGGHGEGFSVGSSLPATDVEIRNIRVNGQRSVVRRGHVDSTGAVIDYDPAAQVLTGAGPHISGFSPGQYRLRTPSSGITTRTAAAILPLTEGGMSVFNGSSLTATLPSAVTAGVDRRYTVKNLNSTALTVGATAGTIDGAATASLAQWQTGRYISDGTNWLSI